MLYCSQTFFCIGRRGSPEQDTDCCSWFDFLFVFDMSEPFGFVFINSNFVLLLLSCRSFIFTNSFRSIASNVWALNVIDLLNHPIMPVVSQLLFYRPVDEKIQVCQPNQRIHLEFCINQYIQHPQEMQCCWAWCVCLKLSSRVFKISPQYPKQLVPRKIFPDVCFFTSSKIGTCACHGMYNLYIPSEVLEKANHSFSKLTCLSVFRQLLVKLFI